MAENVTARTDKDHREALDEMVESGQADSRSEALRQTSQADLARRGFLNGVQRRGGQLAGAFKESAKYLFVAALTWLGVTVWFPFGYRTPAVVLLVAAGASMLCGEVVQQYDVRPLAWLRERRRGEQA